MKTTIWKFSIPLENKFELEMPGDPHCLHVEAKGNHPCLWAIVDPEEPLQKWPFILVATGEILPEDKHTVYLGTFQLAGAAFVFHLFRIFELPERFRNE